MNYRRALIGVVAGASLLGTAGVAHATHQGADYSPCRSTQDDLRAGYSDEGAQGDPRHELPTVYANGGPDSGATGNIGVCGGGSQGQPVQFVEVGNDADGPYATNSDPASAVPTSATGTPADDLGTVNVGDDYVEIDGTEGNAPSTTEIPGTDANHVLDGYASAGLTETQDGQPGICMSGDNNHAYYDTQPQQKDCNDALVAAVVDQLPTP